MEATPQVFRIVRVQVSCLILVALGLLATAPAAAQTQSTVPSPAPKAPDTDPNAKFQFDKDRLFVKSIKDEKPLGDEGDDRDEFHAYNSLVLHALQFGQTDLDGAGRRDVSYKDLFAKNRGDYRFELIQFQGRLKRLKKIEPNEYLKERGIKELYEAWVFPSNDNNPVCFLMLEKPAGVEPHEDFPSSYPVTATGYFFKLFSYQSKEPSEKYKGKFLTRNAPFMVSKSMSVRPIEDNDGGGPWREVFLPAVLTFLGLAAVFALGVTWYFRRGDRRAIKILESKKGNPFDDGAGSPAESPNNAE